MRRGVPVLVAGLLALAVTPRLYAQEGGQAAGGGDFAVDESIAKKGKTLWANRACNGCHTIGKGRLAGPDLAGVTDRRTVEWLQKWLGDTTSMLESDETAKASLAEYNNTKMPDFKLKEADAMALVHYIAQESKKAKKK